ncbi:MAG: type II CAAX endopeptidase family protein [Caulobacteraceae bacterium]
MAVSEFTSIDAVDKPRVRRELIAFFGLTFLITWGIGAVVLLFRSSVERVLGPLGPLNQSWPYFVAVSAPTLSAFLLSFAFGGSGGIKRLLAGLVKPVRWPWVAIAVLAWPAILLIWALIERWIGVAGRSPAVDLHALIFGAPVALFTTAIVFTDPGALGEEFGWRGFALPRLLRVFSPLGAAVLVGVVWTVWHIPAFLTSGLSQSGFNFVWFLGMLIAMSVFMTWLYVNTGSYLVAGIIPHMLLNLVFDANVTRDQPTETVSFGFIALVVVLIFGRGLGRRSDPRTAGAVRPPDFGDGSLDRTP